jgi:hypothetical protein
MDKIITVVKNWPDDPSLNCKPNVNLKEYFKKEDSLTKENYDLLEEANFFEQLQVDNDQFCGLFLWGCGWGKKLVLQLNRVLHCYWGSSPLQVTLFWILLVLFLFC